MQFAHDIDARILAVRGEIDLVELDGLLGEPLVVRIAVIGLREVDFDLLGPIAEEGVFEGDRRADGDVIELIMTLFVGDCAHAILWQIEGGVCCWQGIVEHDATFEVRGLLRLQGEGAEHEGQQREKIS